jgi:hypothetical protein
MSIRELLSTNALMGLVWAVYHFCTTLTKVHRLHVKFVKSWDADLQRKSRKILHGLDKYVAYRNFKFFENVQFGISIFQHHIPGTASGHGSHKNVKTYVAQYILEPI